MANVSDNKFDLIVSNPPYINPDYEDIESIRSKLLMTDMEITIEDHGAGSKVNASNKRRIKDITKNTVKAPKYGQLLFRLVNFFNAYFIRCSLF